MAIVSHGARPLRQGIGVTRRVHPSRSIHVPAFTPRPNPPSTANRVLSETRTFFSRLVSHLTAPASPFALPTQHSPIRPTQFSSSQSINARFSLPVQHALSRPFSPPRLPKPPAVPANVTQVGLGTARAFHSGRPIFQNMVDNVPITTRALWEAEWDVKMSKKEARRMCRATQNKAVAKSQEMLKPKPKPTPLVAEPQSDASELDVYFPNEPTPAVTTHLLVPLAPTPTARLPLSSRTDGGGTHPLLPVSDLASIHTSHRLHTLRVSTLFSRLDTANIWDDPGVNVDAYAFGPRHDAQERQCTVLRVTFRGWHAGRVRAILGDSTVEWYSLEETHPDGRPTLLPLPNLREDVQMNTRTQSPSLESVEVDSSWASEGEMDDVCAVLSPPPMRTSASAQPDLVLPTLDFSSAASVAADSVPSPPQPMILLRTVPELTHDAQLVPSSSSVSTTSSSPPPVGSWECLGLSSSFLQHVGEHRRDEDAMNM